MKRHILFLFVIAGLISSCSNNDALECICTEEFRFYLVRVIDNQSNPVDSLTVTIKDEQGRIYQINQASFPFPGHYVVMDDSYTNQFSILPTKIIFIGEKNSQQVTGEYLFNTDECKCHVQKISGPDSLRINL